ncbi:hypothetical protein MMC30_001556 [Trapelia coarctata]|nr:hypothetical protein [Trapelia coarctata]
MSKTASRALSAQNGGNSATGLRQNQSRPSKEPAQKNSLIEEAVPNDKSVQDVSVGAQTWGIAECDPKYNKEGRLPTGDLKTEVDIIGVPAIGAHPIETWRAGRRHTRGSGFVAEDWSTPLWIVSDIRRAIPKARVLLYDGHKQASEGERLKDLGQRLLRCIHALRNHDKETRPFFLLCHSTGGLVAKLALLEASRGSIKDRSMVADCFGVSFIATPHSGSSYLSLPEFAPTIVRAMRLSSELPVSLRKDFQVNNLLLRSMADEFKIVAADLAVWTFYETEDTDLTIPMTADTREIPLLAPIASIRSALLNLYHENDYPMLSTHVSCASFSGEDTQTKQDFLEDLKQAVERAHGLSKIKHNELKLKEMVEVEVHGFYKGGPQSPELEPPIRLWSIRKSLQFFTTEGPSRCLEQRLEEASVPPQQNQYLSNSAARAVSLDSRPASDLPTTSKSDGSRKYPWSESQQPPNVDGISSVEAPKSPRRLFKSSKSDDGTKKNLPPFLPRRRERPSLSRNTSQASSIQFQTEVARESIPEESLLSMVNQASSNGAPEVAQDREAPQTAQLSTEVAPVTVLATNIPEIRNVGSIDFARIDTSSQTATRADDASRSRALSLPGTESPSALLTPPEVLTERRDSTGGYFTLPPSRLVKPDVSDRKLTWIHVPFNNPTWVSEVLRSISIDKGKNCHEKLLDLRNWESKHVRARQSEHHACFVKPGCSLIPHESGVTSPSFRPVSPGDSNSAHLQMSLYLPYLHWDTYKLMIKRRHLVKRRLAHGRSRPVPEEISKLELEHRVTWAFLGHDPPFNCRRTLDQFGYPNLHDTRPRDDDQMLYKMTKERKKPGRKVLSTPKFQKGHDKPMADDEKRTTTLDPEGPSEEDEGSEEDVLDGTVLMVDQLWLWAVTLETTVTFFPRPSQANDWKRESTPKDGRLHKQADLRNSIYNEVNGDLARRCENSFDLAALVVLHAVMVLFESSSHRDLEVFRIFEESISILIEKMTQSFKAFGSQGFRDKSIDYDSDNAVMSIKDRHKIEGKLSEKQNREDTMAILELRDIHDELQSLRKLFDQQKETIIQMTDVYLRPECVEHSKNGLTILREALDKLTEYIHQVDSMIKSAERTRKDFEKLLDLKQRQANVDEARLARYQADLTSAQSRAVLVFTVFTVIFLPLTFFTGLFGMNINEWSGAATNVSWRTVVEWSIPLSLAITCTALVLALSMRIRKFAKNFVEAISALGGHLRMACIHWISWLGDRTRKQFYALFHQTTPPERKKPKSQRKDAGKGQNENVYYDTGSDFWDNHVDRRENEYHIPQYNRRPKPALASKRRLSHRSSTLKGRSGETKRHSVDSALDNSPV